MSPCASPPGHPAHPACGAPAGRRRRRCRRRSPDAGDRGPGLEVASAAFTTSAAPQHRPHPLAIRAWIADGTRAAVDIDHHEGPLRHLGDGPSDRAAIGRMVSPSVPAWSFPRLAAGAGPVRHRPSCRGGRTVQVKDIASDTIRIDVRAHERGRVGRVGDDGRAARRRPPAARRTGVHTGRPRCVRGRRPPGRGGRSCGPRCTAHHRYGVSDAVADDEVDKGLARRRRSPAQVNQFERGEGLTLLGAPLVGLLPAPSASRALSS